MQLVADIQKEIVELLKQKMELEFTPMNTRKASYTKDLRLVKRRIAVLKKEQHKIRSAS